MLLAVGRVGSGHVCRPCALPAIEVVDLDTPPPYALPIAKGARSGSRHTATPCAPHVAVWPLIVGSRVDEGGRHQIRSWR